ncbi:hypothetical protein [Halpernia sp.]|uniref:hypothetical protein n=1 Tax=Halpernia sp. TaxID=2782209 RepID=UPI003A94CCCC
MIKLYYCLSIFIGTIGLQSQDVLWQKNIQSSSQDFLAPISLTIDGQYLVSGSYIQTLYFRQLYSKLNFI